MPYFISDPCTANGDSCEPFGSCVLSSNAVDGWFCRCIDLYQADRADDDHSCIAGNAFSLKDISEHLIKYICFVKSSIYRKTIG